MSKLKLLLLFLLLTNTAFANTDFFVGVNGGYTSAKYPMTHKNIDGTAVNAKKEEATLGASGLSAGISAGAFFSTNHNYFWGTELGLNYRDTVAKWILRSTASAGADTLDVRNNYEAALDGLLGADLSADVKLYSRFGWALSRFRARQIEDNNTGRTALNAHISQWIHGPRVGVGMSYGITEYLLFRTDFTYEYFINISKKNNARSYDDKYQPTMAAWSVGLAYLF